LTALFFGLLPRLTLSSGAIIRWHIVKNHLVWLGDNGKSAWRCLDVGCGRGEYVLEMARRFSSVQLVLGMDEMGRHSVGRFLPVPYNLRTRVRLMEAGFSPELAAPHGTFDGALCIDVLEHIDRDKGFLSGLASVMSSEGRILIHVPARGQRHPLPGVWRKYLRKIEQGTDQHVREGYEREELVGLLRRAGWSVQTIQPTFGWCAAVWTDLDATLAEAGSATMPLRIALLPLTIFGGWLSRYLRPRSGNGWLVLAERNPFAVSDQQQAPGSSIERNKA
jgi:2-polyprenyl-3-methyl-5-hydroxy-6-metoxy-1,4-benzoquinol methylase